MKILRGDIYENLKMALDTLRANKLRSLLTVVGVVIGVWTVMAIASIISGIDESVKREIESFGTRSIYITKFDPGIQVGRRSREERESRTSGDADERLRPRSSSNSGTGLGCRRGQRGGEYADRGGSRG